MNHYLDIAIEHKAPKTLIEQTLLFLCSNLNKFDLRKLSELPEDIKEKIRLIIQMKRIQVPEGFVI